MTETDKGRQILARHQSLKSARSTWDTLWQELAEYVQPRKAEITSKRDVPSLERETRLFDGTAIRANMILANGQLALATPHEGNWFSFDAPDEIADDDDAKQWFQACTERARAALARSNFYSEIHEIYLDRGAFGTSALWVEAGRRAPLFFRAIPLGSFSLAEDDEHHVDTLFREIKWTHRQAVQKFGLEAVPVPVREAYQSADPAKMDEPHEYVQAVFPREPGAIEAGKRDPRNMPVASVYIHVPTGHVCRESGYPEQPFMATRYLRWGDHPYGWCPAWSALPEARQLNFLEKQMDALAEVSAFPRLLIPDTHEGDVDLRAAGLTYFDPANPNAFPREWATAGRYDIGKDRAEVRRQAIREAFHVDLFTMFAQLDKQMTAREVAERSAEKLNQFVQPFSRLTTELLDPLLGRVFRLMLRAGLMPPPPESVIVPTPDGGALVEPRVSYSSRIALAIKTLQNSGFARSMEMLGPVAQIRPDVFDNYNLDRIARDTARNEGLPADWLRPAEEVQAEREARAQAAQEAVAAQQAEQLASAAGKAGSIKDDSVVGRLAAAALG